MRSAVLCICLAFAVVAPGCGTTTGAVLDAVLDLEAKLEGLERIPALEARQETMARDIERIRRDVEALLEENR